eukprot:CAMPEP_0179327224 /NCGR_PEP_ID=MMETSP0797-20121207/61844_1 /TAXON_ID=47934 /ORGANISM="Dinophysis acuminata, Strain DAEP01" /LENGTH=359 /DNA_ID=CAMNT_0021039527 /DNA_START=538 /DNA_END=1612 /DNA_ORIENTATION=-
MPPHSSCTGRARFLGSAPAAAAAAGAGWPTGLGFGGGGLGLAMRVGSRGVEDLEARDGDLGLLVADLELEQRADVGDVVEGDHEDLHGDRQQGVLVQRLGHEAEGVRGLPLVLPGPVDLLQPVPPHQRLVDEAGAERGAGSGRVGALGAEVLDGHEADVRVQHQRHGERDRDGPRGHREGEQPHAPEPLRQLARHLPEEEGPEVVRVDLVQLVGGRGRAATAEPDELRHLDPGGAAGGRHEARLLGPDEVELPLRLEHQLGVPDDMKGEEVRPVGEERPVGRAQLPRHHEAEARQEQHEAVEGALREVLPDPARIHPVPDPPPQRRRQRVEVVGLEVLPRQHRGHCELHPRVGVLQPRR